MPGYVTDEEAQEMERVYGEELALWLSTKRLGFITRVIQDVHSLLSTRAVLLQRIATLEAEAKMLQEAMMLDDCHDVLGP